MTTELQRIYECVFRQRTSEKDVLFCFGGKTMLKKAEEKTMRTSYDIPGAVCGDERFCALPGSARHLYALLLDKEDLGIINDDVDDDGKVYVVFEEGWLDEAKLSADDLVRGIALLDAIGLIRTVQPYPWSRCAGDLIYVADAFPEAEQRERIGGR